MSQDLICPVCGTTVDSFTGRPKNKHLDATVHNVPFRCITCNAIKFPVRLIHDRVLVWPIPPRKKYGTGILDIPDQYQEIDMYGIVMAFGAGYADKKNRWHPSGDIYVGQHVAYDHTVLQQMWFRGYDGVDYPVKFMGYRDIQGKVEE